MDQGFKFKHTCTTRQEHLQAYHNNAKFGFGELCQRPYILVGRSPIKPPDSICEFYLLNFVQFSQGISFFGVDYVSFRNTAALKQREIKNLSFLNCFTKVKFLCYTLHSLFMIRLYYTVIKRCIAWNIFINIFSTEQPVDDKMTTIWIVIEYNTRNSNDNMSFSYPFH